MTRKNLILIFSFLLIVLDQSVFAQNLKYTDEIWHIDPSILTFSSSSAGKAHTTAIVLPIESLRGQKLSIKVSIKGTGISKKPQSWNGIKVMLKITTPSQTIWPQLTVPDGTFDWRPFSGIINVPQEATAVQLILGLEQVTGKVEMRDLSVRLRPQLAWPPLPAANKPIFTGHGETGLRGAMISPQRITEDDLATLVTGWGANLIRWQLIRPSGESSDAASYDRWLESMLTRLDQALVQAGKLGCRVVIDLHSPPGGGDSPGGYQDAGSSFFSSANAQTRFIEVWKKITLRYRGNQTIWGFDLLNEPSDTDTTDDCQDWNSLAFHAALAIREIDPGRTLIVECAQYGSVDGFVNFRPLPLDRVVYSFHMYTPFEYTHQGVYQNKTRFTYPGQMNGTQWNREALRRSLSPAAEFAEKWRVQMYVGEFGAARWARGAEFYLSDLISLFEEYQWDWSFHAYREWQGWSPEYDENPQSAFPASRETARLKVLKKAFTLNRRR